MDKNKIRLWKWVLLLLLALFLAFVGMALLEMLASPSGHPFLMVLGAAALVLLYYGGVRVIEMRIPSDLPFKRLLPDTGLGLLIGAVFMACVVGVIAAVGCASIASTPFQWREQLTVFIFFLCIAVAEEVMFRGVLFRWIDERFGLWPALIVSSAIFGFMHIMQPNATVWSSLAIAIEAGLLLGAAYKWTGTLWLPIGIHWAWNFVQGNVFGIAVSGGDAGPSFFRTRFQGPEIVTGGAFGAEASIVAVVLGAALSAWFIYRILKRTRNTAS